MSNRSIENDDRPTPNDMAIEASLRMLAELHDLETKRNKLHKTPVGSITSLENETKRILSTEIKHIHDDSVGQLNLGFPPSGEIKFTDIIVLKQRENLWEKTKRSTQRRRIRRANSV